MNISQNERLSFSSPVLLLGASPSGPSLLKIMQKFKCWPLLAADGGLNAAMEAGLLPQIVIGDMDSATGLDHLPNSVRQIRLSGQDDTDFEKCLKLIDAPLIIGIGFLDGRFDHSLAAMDALSRLSHDRPVLLIGAQDILLRLKSNFRTVLGLGSRVSIWPLGCQHFIGSTGLHWPLDNLTMQIGRRTGTSNLTNAETIAINAGKGDGYVVITPLAAFDQIVDAVLKGIHFT